MDRCRTVIVFGYAQDYQKSDINNKQEYGHAQIDFMLSLHRARLLFHVCFLKWMLLEILYMLPVKR